MIWSHTVLYRKDKVSPDRLLSRLRIIRNSFFLYICFIIISTEFFILLAVSIWILFWIRFQITSWDDRLIVILRVCFILCANVYIMWCTIIYIMWRVNVYSYLLVNSRDSVQIYLIIRKRINEIGRKILRRCSCCSCTWSAPLACFCSRPWNIGRIEAKVS